MHLASRNIHAGHFRTDTIPSLYNLLRILVLLKFVQVSNGIHTSTYSFFLKK